MKEKIIEIKNPTGIHARPAAVFVQSAMSFKSDIKIEKDGKYACAKSIISLMALGINKNTIIKIIADGEDENKAIDVLTRLIENNFKT